MSHGGDDKLAKQIMIALVGGLILGLFIHYFGYQEYTVYVKPIGDIFLRLLRMIIVPLVLASIYMAMIGLGSPEELGEMGKKALGYYFVTTALAAFIGLILVNIFQPGVGADLSLSGVMPDSVTAKVAGTSSLYETILGVLIDAIPKNPFHAMANTTILQVIVFSILMGLVALYNKKESAPFTSLMESLEKMTMALTHGIMKLAPIGVGVLMLTTIADSGLSAIKSLGLYMVVVILGLFIHAGILIAIGSARAKKSPFYIIKGVSTALMTAFSTSSSAATLPITMANVQDNLGVQKKTAEFVLPLGATVNMDGTALYESVAVIFIAQAYGIDLTLQAQIIIFLTCSLAAVGAAAIPGAGLITMSIVLKAAGLPLDGIGLILAVDRILDQFRTTVNVLGDCVGTLVVDSFSKKQV